MPSTPNSLSVPVWPPDGEGVAIAARSLMAGELVAIPTETVYGLAANATDDKAVTSIFTAKNRPQFNPLIIHFADEDAVWSHVVPNETAKQLAAAFWPGPLTLVLPKRTSSPISTLAGAGLETLAVRVPAHPTTRLLLFTCKIPLAAPSANRSGEVSPTLPVHVINSLGNTIAGIVDGGPCDIGLESTVVGFENGSPTILRPGGLSAEEIESIVGPSRNADNTTEVSAPGMLLKHYATRSPLRLNATAVEPKEILLGFGLNMPRSAPQGSVNLSESGDVVEAARNLFRMLHEADSQNPAGIAVMPIPEEGLGIAINDRLRRAAET